MAASPLVPDGITPIDAFRAWSYGVGDRFGDLYPVSADFGGSSWKGAESGWVSSYCFRVGGSETGGHHAPQLDCWCGFHAVKEIAFLREMFGHSPLGSVLGRIQLAGTIVEHEFGYRAERARIVELIPWWGMEELVVRLALHLGLPVADPVLPLPLPSGDGPSSPQCPVSSWARLPLAACISSVRLPFAA